MKNGNTATVYTFYWLDGKRQVLPGSDAADALNRAGYGAGALRALDFHAKGDNDEYAWIDGRWRKQINGQWLEGEGDE